MLSVENKSAKGNICSQEGEAKKFILFQEFRSFRLATFLLLVAENQGCNGGLDM
jgi:hypothetical protein